MKPVLSSLYRSSHMNKRHGNGLQDVSDFCIFILSFLFLHIIGIELMRNTYGPCLRSFLVRYVFGLALGMNLLESFSPDGANLMHSHLMRRDV